MTRKLVTLVALIALLSLPSFAQAPAPPTTPTAALAAPAAPSVDELLAKNYAARGGLEKIKGVETIRMTGQMELAPGMQAPFTMEMKRPTKLRTEFTFQGMTGIQAYDGKVAWMVMPFTGKTAPEPMPVDQAKLIREQADMEGPLVGYKEKGHKVELVGKEAFEGGDAYKLKVTMKDGEVRYLVLDPDAMLEIGAEGKRKMGDNEIEYFAVLGDYKEVAGLQMPHVMEMGMKGIPQRQKLTMQKIEVNPPLDDARFVMPEVEPPAAEPPK